MLLRDGIEYGAPYCGKARHLRRWLSGRDQLGTSADRTLELLQKLYEAKLTTYPRTECVYLSADHAQEMPALLNRLTVLPEIAAIAEAPRDSAGVL